MEQYVGIAMIILSGRGERSLRRRGLIRATWLDAWLAEVGTGGSAGPRSAYFALGGAEREEYVPLAAVRAGRLVRPSVGDGTGGHGATVGELRLACLDGYRHLFLKTLHALRWVVERRPGPPPRLVFKVDEDTYICSATLSAQLAPLPRSRPSYVGQVTLQAWRCAWPSLAFQWALQASY